MNGIRERLITLESRIQYLSSNWRYILSNKENKYWDRDGAGITSALDREHLLSCIRQDIENYDSFVKFF